MSSTFALVHGAYHGAWCWASVRPELERRGFRVVAPDLPCDDPRAGLAEYAATVEAELDGDDDVVLVGHSLGSLVIPVVAARRPVRHLIFLCSVPIGPGPPVEGQLDGMVSPAFTAAARFTDVDGREVLANADARQLFFDDCDEAEAARAAGLLRPQGQRPLVEPTPLDAWPEATQSVILTTDDRVLNLDWAIPYARTRLAGRDPVLLPGSHSPFLSRPAELATLLAQEAEQA